MRGASGGSAAGISVKTDVQRGSPRKYCVKACVSLLLQRTTGRSHVIPVWLLHLGFGGVFAVSFLDACPVPLPIPGTTDIFVLLLAAHHALPWLVALSAIAGSLCGGYLTWAAGKKGGEAMMERFAPKRFRQHITRWVEKHAILSVCLAALMPPPVPLLPFLLTAGALGVTRRQLFTALGIARTIRYGAEAALGVIYGRRILRWWNHHLAAWSQPILWTFLGLLTAGTLFGIWKYRHNQRGAGARAKQASTAPAR
jgi:membrane protein YqaA with SNARE-associated domain